MAMNRQPETNEPDTTNDFQKGYQAGRCVRLLNLALKMLHWDSWGEPENDWQRGFVTGFQTRASKVEHEK